MKAPTISFANGLIAALVLSVLFALAWGFDPFGRRQAAEERAGSAEVQADISTAAVGVAGATAIQTQSIKRRAEEAQDALDASTDPDDDLAAWSAGIDRVRDPGGAAGHPGPR